MEVLNPKLGSWLIRELLALPTKYPTVHIHAPRGLNLASTTVTHSTRRHNNKS
jgi:hypothetical protein